MAFETSFFTWFIFPGSKSETRRRSRDVAFGGSGSHAARRRRLNDDPPSETYFPSPCSPDANHSRRRLRDEANDAFTLQWEKRTQRRRTDSDDDESASPSTQREENDGQQSADAGRTDDGSSYESGYFGGSSGGSDSDEDSGGDSDGDSDDDDDDWYPEEGDGEEDDESEEMDDDTDDSLMDPDWHPTAADFLSSDCEDESLVEYTDDDSLMDPDWHPSAADFPTTGDDGESSVDSSVEGAGVPNAEFEPEVPELPTGWRYPLYWLMLSAQELWGLVVYFLTEGVAEIDAKSMWQFAFSSFASLIEPFVCRYLRSTEKCDLPWFLRMALYNLIYAAMATVYNTILFLLVSFFYGIAEEEPEEESE